MRPLQLGPAIVIGAITPYAHINRKPDTSVTLASGFLLFSML
jgi:hypothetical protein